MKTLFIKCSNFKINLIERKATLRKHNLGIFWGYGGGSGGGTVFSPIFDQNEPKNTQILVKISKSDVTPHFLSIFMYINII